MKQEYEEHWFQCEHPTLVRNRYTGDLITVGCGSCSACKSRKIMRHVPALVRESASHKYSMFVTLTYEDKYLPHCYLPDLEKQILKDNPKDYANYCNLKNMSKSFIDMYKGNIPVCQTSDIQKFIKRLRINIERHFAGKNRQIRYAFSYDYGSTLFRPHYHGIIWLDCPELHEQIAQFINDAWSVFNRSTKQRESIGRIDVQDAYESSKYVSAYVQSVDDLPSIYHFKDFRVRLVHSSSPSLGSLLRSLEEPREVVSKGLTKISVYNPLTYEYDLQPLTSSFIRRYFPTIASFKRLSRSERLSIYNLCQAAPYSRAQRLNYFNHQFAVNSFFRDYITLGANFNQKQKDTKFDVLFYTYRRLCNQSSLFNLSVSEYDSLIEGYYSNRAFESLKSQFEHEQRFAKKGLEQSTIDGLIDVASYSNARSVSQYLVTRPSEVLPRSIEGDYFLKMDSKLNKLIKRKCNNAYLELHPEFKQFHN